MVTLKLNSFAAFLGNVSSDNRSRIIFALLNINSIRNKFELLKDQIKDNIDIPMISEKKIIMTSPFLIINFLLKVSVHRIG